MNIKSIASSLVDGAVAAATITHDFPIHTRISEIDEEIARLQQEKAELEEKMISR